MTGKEAAPQKDHSRHMSRLLIAALIAVAIVFIVRIIAPQTVGEQLRRKLVKQLQDHYQGFHISIRRGRYEPKLGFIFEDIRVSDPAQGSKPEASLLGGTQDLLVIDRLIVLADTHPEKLLDKENPFVTRRIVVDGVQVDARLSDDGSIAVGKLWPPPTMGPSAPRIEVRHGKLRFSAAAGEAIEMDIADLVVVNHPAVVGGANAKPASKNISLRGTSNFANSVRLQAELTDQSWEVQGIVRQTRIDADLINRLPSFIRTQLSAATGLSCSCDISFAAKQLSQQPINYQVKTRIHDGRFEHACLPMPMTALQGLVLCGPQGINIQASQAVFGDALCQLAGTIDGFGWPQPAALNFSAKSLLLDDRLAKALPPAQRAQWNLVQPNGRIDIVDTNIKHQNGTWSIESTIQCKGVDVSLAKFPYPVRQLVGSVKIHDGIATCQGMVGRAGGRRLQCGFRMPITSSVKSEKLVVVATDGPIAIDNTLIEALSPQATTESKLESFVRSLRPRGAVHLERASFRIDVSGKKSRTVDLNVMDGHLRYEKFPYPLYNVRGKIRVEDDLLTLSEFQGVNANAGQILCDGSYQVQNDSGNSRDPTLQLHFRASKIPMDESLRSSLPKPAQDTWDAISPSGVLDHLNVGVTQRGSAAPLELDITATETESEQVTNRALSVQPTSLPYRLDVTNGKVHYDGNRVVIESLKARHDGTRISADGGCQPDVAGRWHLLLNIHSGSRLDPNPELVAALPNEMRAAMHQLQLLGPVSIRGRTDVLFADQHHANAAIDWDVVLQLEGNRIGDVGPVHSLRGEISTRGSRNQQGLQADGFVRLDSMHVNDLQITSIRGPYSIRDEQLHLGADSSISSSAPHQTKSSHTIQGHLFDGTIELTGDVILSSASFDVGVSLQHGSVPTLLAEVGHGRSELTGTFTSDLELEGILGTTDLLKGTGSAQLAGANLYQLPLLVQLLNTLRITPTEDVAFTDANVTFTIVEDRINFDDLKLWGDLVSLHGSGTMNWRQELDLTFNTRVSPRNAFSRIMRPLRSQQYTLWDVDVHGPLSDPDVELRPLESVGQTLERIFPAISPRANAAGTKEQSAGLGELFRY